MALLENTACGLYCVAGDFYIDPWRPVDLAVVTHAHSDHARAGSKNYLCATPGRDILQTRLGPEAKIETLDYGKSITRNGVKISLHPAGHILGSAQVRVELRGETWVVSGDYKTEREKTCAPFEPVRCHTFITECTFGLPIYHWRPQAEIFSEINSWWHVNRGENRTSVLFAYSLGKSQRLLSGIDPGIGPIFVHGSVANLLPQYASAGIDLPKTMRADPETIREADGKGLVIAPASTDGSPWLRKFGATSKAFASGWMQLRGASARRRALDRVNLSCPTHAGLERPARNHSCDRSVNAFIGRRMVTPPRFTDGCAKNGYEAEACWATQFDAGESMRKKKAGKTGADAEETPATIQNEASSRAICLSSWTKQIATNEKVAALENYFREANLSSLMRRGRCSFCAAKKSHTGGHRHSFAPLDFRGINISSVAGGRMLRRRWRSRGDGGVADAGKQIGARSIAYQPGANALVAAQNFARSHEKEFIAANVARTQFQRTARLE